MSKVIYLIGSLRNPEVPKAAKALREYGFEVFDDWHAGGPDADDCWRDYEIARGHTYPEALQGYAAKHVFEFDLFHLNRADIGVLMYPAGKSGHLELGYMIGQGKPGYVLLDAAPERYDVMLQFAKSVHYDVKTLAKAIGQDQEPPKPTAWIPPTTRWQQYSPHGWQEVDTKIGGPYTWSVGGPR